MTRSFPRSPEDDAIYIRACRLTGLGASREHGQIQKSEGLDIRRPSPYSRPRWARAGDIPNPR